ncbi:hypothetical protein UPYG_G00137210 [Umbra pygmaea]|uniref:Uncharacterized protein n=1 Tax=Umbra pygmaea TaxID=75934 RepID=A0ABD0WUG8_UMBPY
MGSLERRALAFAESARALFTNQDLTTARAVPTRKGSVPCVGKRFWTPRTTNRPLSDNLRTCIQVDWSEGGKTQMRNDCFIISHACFDLVQNSYSRDTIKEFSLSKCVCARVCVCASVCVCACVCARVGACARVCGKE